ncbi:MAG: hypothetical protein DRJ05_01325 [Bacteroidetes bacterium]|nr:MAG: hypothetical protein DRJ05_01325 [Bacteroidota bacterium]
MKKISFTVLLAFVALSIFAQIKIAAPQLIEPENEAINQMPNALLDWNPVSGSGSITYDAQLDEDPDFSNPVLFTNEFSSYEMENLLFGHTYYWKVMATDENGPGDWSEVFEFTLFDQLTNNKPNDTIDNQVPNVLLKWKNKAGSGSSAVDISGIGEFEYEVSFDDAFTDIYIESSVSGEEFEVACAELFFDTTYYWHVRAIHGLDECEWSETWSFSTMASPVLVSPVDGATNQMLDAVNSWEIIENLLDESGVSKYSYQLCTDPNFINPCASLIVDSTSVSMPGLEFGETYYWRVNAFHSNDTSNWSEPWSFEIINTVILDSPGQGDTTNVSPLFEWIAQTGIEQYELNYSKSADFTNAEPYFIAFPSSDFQVVFTLDLASEYYWRVRAILDGDTTNWSDTWSFFTPFPEGIEDNILNYENVNIYPNPSNGILNVELEDPDKSIIRVSVMDLLGQTVFENEFGFGNGIKNQKIDLTDLENGLYIIKLENGNRVYNQKFILDK